MSPTEQAKGDSGKEPKLPLWQNGEKKKTLGETRLSRGASSPLANQTVPLRQDPQFKWVRITMVDFFFKLFTYLHWVSMLQWIQVSRCCLWPTMYCNHYQFKEETMLMWINKQINKWVTKHTKEDWIRGRHGFVRVSLLERIQTQNSGDPGGLILI